MSWKLAPYTIRCLALQMPLNFQLVGKDWNEQARFAMRAVVILLLAAVVVVQGCAVPEFRQSETVGMPENDLEIIHNRWGCPFCIMEIRDVNDGDKLIFSPWDRSSICSPRSNSTSPRSILYPGSLLSLQLTKGMVFR